MIEKKTFYNDFTDEQSISSLVNNGKNGYWNSFWSVPNRRKRYMKSYNLFGDPSLKINGMECHSHFAFSNPESFEDSQKVGYEAENYIRNENAYVLNPGSEVEWKAGKQITIKPGFHAKEGSHFVATIAPCDKKRGNGRTVKKTELERDDRDTNIDENRTQINTMNVSFHPNPVTKDITLTYFIEKDSYVTISLIGVMGIRYVLFEGSKEEGPCSDVFSLDNIPSGLYVIQIKTNRQQYAAKLIKQ